MGGGAAYPVNGIKLMDDRREREGKEESETEFLFNTWRGLTRRFVIDFNFSLLNIVCIK